MKNNKNNANEELFVKKFIESNEKFKTMLPELHEMILSLSPFTQNKIQVQNAWTNFKQMDQWISNIMKDGFEMLNKPVPAVAIPDKTITQQEENKQ